MIIRHCVVTLQSVLKLLKLKTPRKSFQFLQKKTYHIEMIYNSLPFEWISSESWLGMSSGVFILVVSIKGSSVGSDASTLSTFLVTSPLTGISFKTPLSFKSVVASLSIEISDSPSCFFASVVFSTYVLNKDSKKCVLLWCFNNVYFCCTLIILRHPVTILVTDFTNPDNLTSCYPLTRHRNGWKVIEANCPSKSATFMLTLSFNAICNLLCITVLLYACDSLNQSCLTYCIYTITFVYSVSSSLANKTLVTLHNVVSTYLPLYLLGCSKASQPVGTTVYICHGKGE